MIAGQGPCSIQSTVEMYMSIGTANTLISWFLFCINMFAPAVLFLLVTLDTELASLRTHCHLTGTRYGN